MARIKRYGYIIEWFLGDHVPKHVHVYDGSGAFFGRLDVGLMKGIEGWTPDRKLVRLIHELKDEGRL